MFEIPDDMTVAYFYYPFVGETFQRVIDNIIASLDRRPRRTRLVYVLPVMEEYILETGRFHLRNRCESPTSVTSTGSASTTDPIAMSSIPDHPQMAADDLRAAALSLLDEMRPTQDEIATSIEQVLDIEYWRALVPELAIGNPPSSANLEDTPLDDAELARIRDSVRERGYYHTSKTISQEFLNKLRVGVDAVRDAGWHPVYVFLYDEAWRSCPHPFGLPSRPRCARRELQADTERLVPLRSCRATVKRLASTSRRASRGHDGTADRVDSGDGGDPRQRVHVRHS